MATSKKVTLVAKTFVAYRGKRYGAHMQFEADAEDAAALIKSGEAAEAPPKTRGHAAAAATTAEAPKRGS